MGLNGPGVWFPRRLNKMALSICFVFGICKYIYILNITGKSFTNSYLKEKKLYRNKYL